MNAVGRIFKTPWLASVRTPHSYLFAFIVFMLAMNVGKALPIHAVAAQWGIAALVAALVITWIMVANMLWLAHDARALRLPGVERDADAALALFAVASIVVPALVLGALFGHPGLWLVSLALVATGTLAFCILPPVLALPLLFVMVVMVVMVVLPPLGLWQLPLPGEAGFLAWALPALIVLIFASLQRWIAIRRTATLESTPWRRPTFAGSWRVQLRRLRGGTYHASDFAPEKKPGTSTCASLNRVGPEHPIRSIQTALGQYLKPLDLVADSARSRRLQLLFTALVLTLPFLGLLAQHYLGTDAILRQAPLLLLWMALGTILLQVGKNSYPLATCWSHRSSDLPLLALLPRLSNTARVRRDALMAGATRALLVKCLLAFSSLLALMVLELPAMFYLYLVLMFVCGALGEIALVAGIVGGNPLGKFAPHVLSWSALIPTVTTMSLGIRMVGHAHPLVEMLGWQALVCIALWLVWCAGFALLAWCGWRALQRRPHPFLPNPPA